MIPHTDLATHDDFNFTCIHTDLDDGELNVDNYWSYFNHQWEEGSHMLVEEVMEIDLGDDPSALKMVQFNKSLQANELVEWIPELKKSIKVFIYA